MERHEKVARLLAEVAVLKNPRSYGIESCARFTTDTVAQIVERSWPGYVQEAEELERRMGFRPDGYEQRPARTEPKVTYGIEPQQQDADTREWKATSDSLADRWMAYRTTEPGGREDIQPCRSRADATVLVSTIENPYPASRLSGHEAEARAEALVSLLDPAMIGRMLKLVRDMDDHFGEHGVPPEVADHYRTASDIVIDLPKVN